MEKTTVEKTEEQERLDSVKQAVKDYIKSEGCSCCQNTELHKDAERRLAGLLNIPMYSDGSGYDWYGGENQTNSNPAPQ